MSISSWLLSPAPVHKEAEHRRIDAFKLWCWRRLLRVLWTAKRSNQSMLKKINSAYSLEGLMLKLRLEYFGHLMQRVYSLEKTPDAGRDWGQKEKGATEDEMAGWHHRLYGYEFEQTQADGEEQGSLACCSPWGSQRVRHDWATEQQLWFCDGQDQPWVRGGICSYSLPSPHYVCATQRTGLLGCLSFLICDFVSHWTPRTLFYPNSSASASHSGVPFFWITKL